jgi:broad specificity phosphatase PhoE
MSPQSPSRYRRVILIRHGESTANYERSLTGRSDPELTSRGKKQAKRIARFLHRSGWRIDALYSSPLKRTLHTARYISKRLGIPIRKEELILEMNFGEWEGQGKKDLAGKPVWEQYAQNPFHFTFPGGESPQDVRKRIGIFIDALRSSDDWSGAVVVSHYTPIAFFILSILDQEDNDRAPFAVGNASVNVVRISDTSGYIEQLNCTCR